MRIRSNGGIVGSSEILHRGTDMGIRLGIVRFDFQRQRNVGQRFVHASGLRPRHAQKMTGGEIAWIIGQHLEIQALGLRPSSAALQRDGLIAVGPGKSDRRSKELRLTDTGAALLRTARKGWEAAQAQFETGFGVERSKKLRDLLHEVATSEPAAA